MDETSHCQKCDVPLSGHVVGGLCANCLLKLALEPAEEPTAVADERGEQITVAAAAPREVAGSRIGRYKLLQEIGEGGFGIVYLADQLEPVKRRVALKVLKPGMDTREVVARFEAERQSLALMDHPNIARIFDGGQTESGRPYFVMELVKGVPLTKYCDDQQLTTRQRLDLFLDVLAAVQHAHQKGIIHRDLKPSNILVSPHDGRPVIKVIDFGIAKAISLELTDKTLFTAHGRMIGTPQYMSPEQAEINALDVDTRSDLYSLGIILYELLTGRTPLDGKKLRKAAYAEIQRLIREEEPPKPSTRLKQEQTATHQPDSAHSALRTPQSAAERSKTDSPRANPKGARGRASIDQDLDWIVMKALEKDRTRRYETANGFAADLRRHLENQPVVARPPGTGYLLSRFVRRHKFGFAAGAAVSMALLTSFASVTWGLVREWSARKALEAEVTKTKTANEKNKHNLHLASMADLASAVKALEEDSEATLKGQHASGFAGKSRWHEGVILLTRSLEREPENAAAALRLYETLRSRQAEKRDWSLLALKHDRGVRSRSVGGASFSPDGAWIVTASGDKTARLWNAVTGQALGQSPVHEGRVYSAIFSRDGTKVVTASEDMTARVWDAVTGRAIGEPMRHEGYVLRASFSPDGARIVTASGDKTARIWDATTGQPLGHPMRHKGEVRNASFSPDGIRIITVSGDETARIWHATTGQSIGELLHHKGEVNNASFSPDGSKIVTASRDKAARVWDTATGRAIGEPMRHEGSVNWASFSPDGVWIVTASTDKTARIWDATTGQGIGEPMRHEGDVRNASFSPDGTKIVTGCGEWHLAVDNGYAQIWEAATGQGIGGSLRHEGIVVSATFSPDGSKIVTASGDNTTRLWDAATGQVQAVGEPMRHEGEVVSATLSLDGTRIVTASGDKTARVWDAATGQPIGGPLRHETVVRSASFSPDGIRVVTATASRDNSARVWDAVTGRAIGKPMRHEADVWSANFSPDGTKVVTASSDQTARVWDSATGQAIGSPLRHEGEVKSASFSPDGTRIVTAGTDATARVWNGATGRAIGEPLRHEYMDVTSASFSPDGTRIVTANFKTAQAWDASTGQASGEPMRHEWDVCSASFSPEGARIVTASHDNTARVWDAVTGNAIGGPLRHGDAVGNVVTSANFSPDGTKVVSASSDKSARVWDATTGQALRGPLRHTGRVNSAIFSPVGTRIVTVTDKTALIWTVLTKAESDAIEAITPEILAWARNFAGLRFSEDGELHLIPDDERIAAITTPALAAGPWSDLASWISTPASQRTIDPKSKSTLRQIAERERDFDGDGTVDSLESALRYDPTVPLAHLFLAAALEKQDAPNATRNPDLPPRAAFLRRYDLDALAREAGKKKNEDLAALWVRAANHLLKLPPEAKIGVGPKPTTAREEAAKAARKALELVPGLPAAEEALKKF